MPPQGVRERPEFPFATGFPEARPRGKYKGKAITLGNTAIDFGGGNFLFMHCIREDSPTNNNCAVIGGTGRYGGARGTAVEDAVHGVEDKKHKTFTFPVTVTFLP